MIHTRQLKFLNPRAEENTFTRITSAEKSNEVMAANAHHHGQHMPYEMRPGRDANSDLAQAKHYDQQIDPTDIDRLYQFHHKYKPQPIHPAVTSYTPPGASPLYYDPLHLRNMGQEFSPGHFQNGFELDLDRSGPYPSYPVRGILKKNLSSSNHSLATSGDDSVNFNKPKSVHISPNNVTCNPVMVPPYNPNEAQTSPKSVLQDPNRVSAFTPVTSRRNLPLSQEPSQGFTPVKGPAVLDFVSSFVEQAERDISAPQSPPSTHSSSKQPNTSRKNARSRKQVLPVETFPHHTSTPSHHSTPPYHHSTPPYQHSTPPHRGPIHLHKTLSSHQPTPSPHYSTPPQLQSTPQYHQSTPSHVQQYQTPPHQHSTLPHPHSLPGHPIPAPRRSIRNLQQSFESISVQSGSRTSGSCSSGSPSSQVETLTNEAVRLRHFLDTATAKDLKRFLRDQLDSKNPTLIQAMSKLIPVSVAKQIESHCVRCHKDFKPNERGRCFLPHPESMVVKINQDEAGADFICHCCSTGFRLLKMDFYEETTNALLTGHCYSGQHTTNKESVDYRVDKGAAKSCEENGCVEFYV